MITIQRKGALKVRLKITLKTDHLKVPLGANAILQGFVYHLLDDYPEYSRAFHDTGYKDVEGDSIKPFTFSELIGKYDFDKETKTLVFKDDVTIYVSSPDIQFCNMIIKTLYRSDRIKLNSQKVEAEDVFVTDEHVRRDKVRIEMMTPIVVRKYMEDGKYRFLSPEDEEWNAHLKRNFAKKYSAMTGQVPKVFPSIEPVKVSEKDKVVTKFKGKYFITGYKGRFELTGPAPYLDFLYQTGIGASNSQGFGMFNII